jgi:hypothetical protein
MAMLWLNKVYVLLKISPICELARLEYWLKQEEEVGNARGACDEDSAAG